MAKRKLGEILRDRGLISAEDLADALGAQQRKLNLLGEVLLERSLIAKDDLVSALEEVTHDSYVDCLYVQPDARALKAIPRDAAVRYAALPIGFADKKLVVVMAEPQNIRAVDELRFLAGTAISPRLGFRKEILAAIGTHYGITDRLQGETAGGTASFHAGQESELEFVSVSSRSSNREAIEEIQAELKGKPTPAVQLVSCAILAAMEKGASDIHLEPQDKGLVVRIRVDGILRELTQAPPDLQATVISRIKVLADLDIAERRKPQDGRIMVRLGNKSLDLRISSLPTHRGEKIVIRLLDPDAPRLLFRDLGMPEKTCETLHRILHRPQGMFLVTGPTGSGKTTTLYAALNQLRSPSVNIVTVEDPVEYVLEGISQVHVRSKAGLTFAQCLRSILRQDPNIIMVGEIRDAETAEIALKAAQTGHLVLTTVHTNDSVAAIARLTDLQIPPSLIASSLTAIMSQRLVRKLCSCHERVTAAPEYKAHFVAAGMDSPNNMFVAGKCSACDDTGYRGRVSVSEILVFDEQVRSLIRSEARPEEIRVLARSSGMRTIQEDALDKVRGGLTTLDEVLRVIAFEEFDALRCSRCSRELAQTFIFCPYCGTTRDTAPGAEPATVSTGQRGIRT